ncbi:MAG: virulence RhuM family protein [Kiritimatiellae bacterium]|nr:virulence RhuM family protein [Kiritimatiellia bacterium]
MPRKKPKKFEPIDSQKSSAAQFLTYVASTGAGDEKCEIRYEDENIWMSQKMLAAVYGVEVPNISYHLRKLFDDAELDKESVIKEILITATDGKSYSVNHYNLQVIIALGFKIDNERAVQFRKWANQIVSEYTIKGWVMDDQRLKDGSPITDKYFEQQLERIREIRLSERKFYQKITDLYATAIDYDRTANTTRVFFATVQNRMHQTVHGRTAAELIFERADADKEHMGLTTWEDAPDGKIQKFDVTVAKNYLTEEELQIMGRIVNAFLDFAELKTIRKIPLTMEDWRKQLESFLEFFDRHPPKYSGDPVSAFMAQQHAETEFEKYRVMQDHLFMSDYDRYLLELEEHVKREKGDAEQ